MSQWIPLLLALTLFAGACVPIQAPAGDAATGGGETAAEEVASESDAGSLVVYSGRSENLVGPLIEQFRDATGIDVQVRYGSTPEIAATLLEEGANSPADVFFAQDPGGLGAVANAGLLAPLPEEIVGAVEEQFRSPSGEWVGVAGRARVAAYNTDAVSEADLPDDLAGFTDPVWAGRVAWVPGNASFQAMVTAMRVLWGEEETRAWLEAMRDNGTVTYDGNATVVEALGAGEIEVGLVNHYYLYRFLAEQGDSFPVRNYFLPGGGPGSLLMVAGAGRVASGANEENALRFIEYLVSPEAQEYFVTQTNEYPVVAGVTAPEGLTPVADLNRAQIDLSELSDLQGTTQLLREVGLLE